MYYLTPTGRRPRKGRNALQEALGEHWPAGEPDNGYDNSTIVRMLLSAGADVSTPDPDGNTVLVEALSNKNGSAVPNLLISAGARVDCRESDGDTALMIACHRPDMPIATIRMMLDRGADPNLHGSFGVTALMCAVRADRQDTVRLLLDRGADINATDSNGDTVLARIHPPDVYDLGPSDALKAMLKRAGAKR